MKKQFTPINQRPDVTTPTVSEYEGIPMLALPGNHPKFPIQMTLPKWRIILANLATVQKFVNDNAGWQPAPKEQKKGKTVPMPTPAPAPAAAPAAPANVEMMQQLAALAAKLGMKLG